MEAQPESGSLSAAYPRWVMFEEYLEIKVEDSSCSLIGDARTQAAAHTSAGHQIQVSLRLAEPPALSRVLLRIPDVLKEEKSKVLAAHGDSVLIQVRIMEKYQKHYMAEHFVYNAGARGAEHPRPPSLLLLPAYYERTYFSGSDLVPREHCPGATGLLRRGEDEIVVAELTERSLSKDTPKVGDLYLFRSSECKWRRYHFKVGEDWVLAYLWNAVVAVDNRLLCWVDSYRGVMLLDASVGTPMVQYIQLPTAPRQCVTLNRNVCTTAGGGALKFVNIFRRCCCGATASSDCEHSRHAYTIHTWMMRIDRGNMEWVKDGIVDATELWALDAHKDLPCDPLDRPVVSLDEPEVICFRLHDTKCGSRTLWQIMVNMRSKTIQLVSRHEQEVGYKLIPSNVSYFFNTLTGQIQIDDEKPPAVAIDEQLTIRGNDSRNPTVQQSSVAELTSVRALLEMFEALQEIPSYGLGPDEVKAYRILNSDNGRQLRSLLRLPKDLRKDWLLMEIKADNAN